MPSEKCLPRLLGIVFLDQICIAITTPLLAILFFDPQSHLFVPEATEAVRSMWYGLCVTLPHIMNMFFAPLLSTLSDEFGRKRMLLIEILSAFVFTLLVGLGVYFGWLGMVFLGFAIKGAFARINPTALAMVGDISHKNKKILNMSYLQFAISVGAALGPILGGYMAHRYALTPFNFSLPFFISALLALLNGALAYLIIRETLKRNTDHPPFFRMHAVKQIVTQSAIARLSLLLFLIQISWSTYYQFIPPLLKIMYHFSSSQLGLFMGLIATWLILMTGVGMKLLSACCSPRQLLIISIYLVLIGLLLTLGACYQLLPHAMIWFGAIPTAAGDVMAYSCLTAFYSDVVAHDSQGKAMGISFIVVSFTWALTGLLGGMLLGIHPAFPLLLAPIGVLLALILMYTRYAPFFVEERVS